MAINNRQELTIARICTVATLITLAGLFHFLWTHASAAYTHHHRRALLETVLFAAGMIFVAYGNLLYQICLVGYYKRRHDHRPATHAELEALYAGAAPSLSILIPSYKEEYNVNWQTMMSAALSEYPHKDVVLLIDDPHQPKSPDDIHMLEKTRTIPLTLQRLFDAPLEKYRAELDAFNDRAQNNRAHFGVELNRLSMLYDEVADWLDQLASDFIGGRSMAALSHIDRFYVDAVVGAPAKAHRERAERYRLGIGGCVMSLEDIRIQYQRLSHLFDVRFSSFERKKYVNLSHEANKAMNLNSYIPLIGKSWKEVEMETGPMLLECAPEHADFTIPAADYVNTIDSDSMMLSDYVLRLVHMMEQPGNERIAVTQSPCSAYPGSQNGLERAAAACIDLQFKTHQGYTHWNATFWVGANAMLRYAALQDIREMRQENGHEISVYIQDSTVIEDTESSIDLVHKGWQLCNYPERMTFSSMPSDFGSLLIQRRRWANGGLLILPKLLSYAMRAPKRLALFKELFMRFHYLASTASGCVVAMLFLCYPFSNGIGTVWIPLSAVPCALLYLRDLRNTGYRTPDYLRICTLNMLLLPVVMGGVLKSLQQMVTGKKIPFSRTPKVPGRTAAPALYSFIAAFLPFCCLGFAAFDARSHHTGQGVVALINGALFLYALVFLIGVRATFFDIGAGLRAGWREFAGNADEWLTPIRAFLPGKVQRS